MALVYVAIAGGVVAAMHVARGRVVSTFADGETQSSWERFREDTAQSQGAGGVDRRVPISAEPPALVLMRDHYATCLGGVLMMYTGIYVSLAAMIRGVLNNPGQIDLLDDERSRDKP